MCNDEQLGEVDSSYPLVSNLVLAFRSARTSLALPSGDLAMMRDLRSAFIKEGKVPRKRSGNEAELSGVSNAIRPICLYAYVAACDMPMSDASVPTDDATARLRYVSEHIKLTIVARGKLDQVEYGKHRSDPVPRPSLIPFQIDARC